MGGAHGSDGVGQVLQRAAAQHARRPALLASGREPLTYDLLPRIVGGTVSRLRERGITSTDRVALVVDNGPEAASAFLALSCGAVCAPLNPAYRSSEFEFYLDDLKARAVVVGGSVGPPVREAAASRGIEVLELEPLTDAPAGVFALGGSPLSDDGTFEARRPEETALLLHTSGTTSRPKLVPLTHANLAASARNIAETLRLEPDDVCLNVMPLFHIHGLVAALLSSLHAGAAVGCTPGFHPLRVFDWLRQTRPTWYTAVPTMHQAVLSRLGDNADLVRDHRLRFVRSSSAALPVPVLDQLEATLEIPAVEAYGMTEAAHQVASNPLPPAGRLPGTVGPGAGPEIAIIGPDGDELPVGTAGEVAIRGENVFGGYEANPEANAAAFVDGWFRTGDEGTIDDDGYLTLHARLKEIINRGGEKVAPAEVDSRLLAYPAVAQAVTFAIPHPLLGEEVGAAVVLAPDQVVDEGLLQDFVAETLAPFKVPRRIVFVDEIPKGPTGKVQRIGLSERLAVGLSPDSTPAGEDVADSLLEEELARIWASVLEVETIGVHDDFFAFGGDSILGAEAIARIRELIDRDELPLTAIVRASSVRAMARLLRGDFPELEATGAIPLQTEGAGRPIFLIHGNDGEIIRFVTLARRFRGERPVYALRAAGIEHGWSEPPRIEDLAAEYVDAVRGVYPEGPYIVAALCFGATVALEMAHQLGESGDPVDRIVLIDPRFGRPSDPRFLLWLVWQRARERRLAGALGRRLARRDDGKPARSGDVVCELLDHARDTYRPQPSDAPATVIFSSNYFERYGLPEWLTRRLLRRPRRWVHVPVPHDELLRETGVDYVVRELDETPTDRARDER